MTDPQNRLEQAKAAARSGATPGIGGLGEKRLHAILKYYYEPDPACHEAPFAGFVADVRNANGVWEVQTRSFEKLRRKLAVFLAEGPVTLVFPLPRQKWLRWLDDETGELTPARKSPKTGQAAEACFELGKLGELLCHPRLHIRLLLLDVEEIRHLDGWSRDRKRGSSRAERLPLAVAEEICLDSPGDYLRLLPAGLPAAFTSGDLARAARLSPKRTQHLLTCLRRVGAVERTGRQGRSYLYQINKGEPQS